MMREMSRTLFARVVGSMGSVVTDSEESAV